jgi:uncharacterized protein Yka (UPF0111/DUF47 family)
VDDALDAVHAAAARLVIYDVVEVKKPARRLARLIVESAQELDAAIKGLRDKKLYSEVQQRIVQINTLPWAARSPSYYRWAALRPKPPAP